MKKISRFVCAILVASIFLVTPVYAVSDSDPRASKYFGADSCYLYKTSSTEFQVCYNVTGATLLDEVGANTVIVQRSEDGENWTNMQTYSKADYPEMVDHDSVYHSCSFTYTAEPGYYYRAYVQFYGKLGTGTGILDRYTSKIQV